MSVNELKEIINNWGDRRYRLLFRKHIINILTTRKSFVQIFSPVVFILLMSLTQNTLNILAFDGYNFGDITRSLYSLIFSSDVSYTIASFRDRVNVAEIAPIKQDLWWLYFNYAEAYKGLYLCALSAIFLGSVGVPTWVYSHFLQVPKQEGRFEIEINAEDVIEPEIVAEESFLTDRHENGTQIGAMPSVILGNQHYQYQIGKLKIKPKLIRVDWTGLRTHTLITGTTGTGKTQFALYPITRQLLSYRPDDEDKKLGALILDVKGDYYKKVLDFAKSVGRLDDVRIITLGGKYKYNPLHKPDMLANELAARVIDIARTRDRDRTGNDAFWENQGKAFIENSIRLARLHSGYVSFKIIDTIIRLRKHGELLQDLKVRVDNGLLTEEELYTYNKLVEYFLIEIDQGREQVAKIMKTVEQTIQPMINSFLAEKVIEDTFSPPKEKLNFFGFEEMINEGLIIVLKMDTATYPDLAPFIAAYLALDFQKTTLQRIKKDTKLNVVRPLALICDEVHFMMTRTWGEWLSVARQSNTAGVFATQSYQSLIEKMDEKIVASIIQNVNNKIWLRSEDKGTIEDVVRTAGKFEKEKQTRSVNETALKGGLDLTGGTIKAKKSNVALNTSITTEERDRIRYDQFRNEMPDYVAFVSVARQKPKDRDYKQGSKLNTLVYLNHWTKYGSIEEVTEEEELLLVKSAGTNNSLLDIDVISDEFANDTGEGDKNRADTLLEDKEDNNTKENEKISEIESDRADEEEREKNIREEENTTKENEKIIEDKELDIYEQDEDISKTGDIEEKLLDEAKDYVEGAKTGVGVATQSEMIKEIDRLKDAGNLKDAVEKVNKIKETPAFKKDEWFDF
jgi:hypothetical protein